MVFLDSFVRHSKHTYNVNSHNLSIYPLSIYPLSSYLYLSIYVHLSIHISIQLCVLSIVFLHVRIYNFCLFHQYIHLSYWSIYLPSYSLHLFSYLCSHILISTHFVYLLVRLLADVLLYITHTSPHQLCHGVQLW